MRNVQTPSKIGVLLASKNFPENQKRPADDNDEEGNGKHENENCFQNFEENQDTRNGNDDPKNDK